MKSLSHLEADDLQVGLYVTIIKGQLRWRTTGDEEYEDTSFQGDVMQIMAIDLPFVNVYVLGKVTQISHVFDIRKGWQFKLLSPDFVASTLERKVQPCQPQEQ